MPIIDGKQIAARIIAELKNRPAPKKFLAAFLVGQNPASLSFLKQKEKIAKELGIDFRLYQFTEEIKQDELRKEILKIVLHKTCGGAIIQLPLLPHINKDYVLNAVPREKDIDVLSERALGAFYNNRNPVLPPPVSVLKTIAETINLDLKKLKIAVVGLGVLVGKPIALWLINQKIGNICLIEENGDLNKISQADLVISGVGKAGLIKPEMLKENTIVIDFGYSLNQQSKITGDFDTSNENLKLKIENLKYTPTPGGTGPILVAELFRNFYKLNT